MSHARLFERGVADRNTFSRDSSQANASRHLAAILAADVAGYSRLMGVDEERTHERLKGIRHQLVDPKIEDHHGRIVNTTGDGMLVEFPSVVDAVRCAVELQRAMVDRNTDIAEDKRITFRVGVNLGDVIAEGGDIYGDGVNVAARLEALAEPGGICISGTVWDHIRDKLPYAFKDMGEQNVKNIARPVRVYAMDADAVGSVPFVAAPTQVSAGHPGGSATRSLLAASVVAVIAAAAAGVWWQWPQKAPPTAAVQTPAATGSQGSPATNIAATVPRLSIVVLPFTNLSKDPEQEYFVDGITDDLTTDLSQIPDSLVIARNTAFTYKGKAVDAKQVGRDLGVRYVLEGSVRRMGEQVQANVQLIDGETGAHVWADRFETDRRNLADAQSQITGRLARTLHLELVQDAARRIEQERSVDPDARDLVMRGWAFWYRPFSIENRQEAQWAFERALEIDPRSVDARIGIALVLAGNLLEGFSSSVREDEEHAEKLLREALARDANRSMAHAAMGQLRRAQDRQAEAQAELETAIALDRNNSWAIRQLGVAFMLTGRPESCIPYVEKSLRLNPRDGVAYMNLGKCHLLLGNVDEAMPLLRKSAAMIPGSWAIHLKLAGALGLKGETDEARAEAVEMVRRKPDMNSVARVRGYVWYRNPQFQVLHDRTVIQGLRNAGFPEEVAAQQ
jgi:TolB-like protein/class 3 adenylate cyclase/Flp pilus assembly protein TadD